MRKTGTLLGALILTLSLIVGGNLFAAHEKAPANEEVKATAEKVVEKGKQEVKKVVKKGEQQAEAAVDKAGQEAEKAAEQPEKKAK